MTIPYKDKTILEKYLRKYGLNFTEIRRSKRFNKYDYETLENLYLEIIYGDILRGREQYFEYHGSSLDNGPYDIILGQMNTKTQRKDSPNSILNNITRPDRNDYSIRINNHVLEENKISELDTNNDSESNENDDSEIESSSGNSQENCSRNRNKMDINNYKESRVDMRGRIREILDVDTEVNNFVCRYIKLARNKLVEVQKEISYNLPNRRLKAMLEDYNLYLTTQKNKVNEILDKIHKLESEYLDDYREFSDESSGDNYFYLVNLNEKRKSPINNDSQIENNDNQDNNDKLENNLHDSELQNNEIGEIIPQPLIFHNKELLLTENDLSNLEKVVNSKEFLNKQKKFIDLESIDKKNKEVDQIVLEDVKNDKSKSHNLENFKSEESRFVKDKSNNLEIIADKKIVLEDVKNIEDKSNNLEIVADKKIVLEDVKNIEDKSNNLEIVANKKSSEVKCTKLILQNFDLKTKKESNQESIPVDPKNEQKNELFKNNVKVIEIEPETNQEIFFANNISKIEYKNKNCVFIDEKSTENSKSYQKEKLKVDSEEKVSDFVNYAFKNKKYPVIAKNLLDFKKDESRSKENSKIGHENEKSTSISIFNPKEGHENKIKSLIKEKISDETKKRKNFSFSYMTPDDMKIQYEKEKNLLMSKKSESKNKETSTKIFDSKIHFIKQKNPIFKEKESDDFENKENNQKLIKNESLHVHKSESKNIVKNHENLKNQKIFKKNKFEDPNNDNNSTDTISELFCNFNKDNQNKNKKVSIFKKIDDFRRKTKPNKRRKL